jgi:glutamate decarboxylase
MTSDKIKAMPVSNDCNLEVNRVAELENIVKPALDIIINYIKEIDSGKRNIGPHFDNPKDLYRILNLENIDKLFETSIQKQTERPNEEILKVFEKILDNSVTTWHPGFMDKLYAGSNPIGLLSDLLLSILNTNSHVFTVSPALTAIERKVAQRYANLFGFNGEFAGGLTFNGGSWSNITSLQIARSYKYPDTKTNGNGSYKFAIFTSAHSHYSVEKAAILLGFGANSVFKIPVNNKGEMDIDILEETIKKSIDDNFTPLYINATAGTTVFGSFDPLEEISEISKKYNLWFHIDGSWGGNVIFSTNHKQYLKGSHLADSITSNPHKMLGVPTSCSFLLLPDERVFVQANSLDAPYLFHNCINEDENFDLANGTMGCGRRADSLKMYMAWLYYGQKGFQQRVDHAYSIAEYCVYKLQNTPGFTIVNELPITCLQVCFYYNPSSDPLKGRAMTALTRKIATKLHQSGGFLVDFAPNPNDSLTGEDNGEFFRCVFNSPNVTTELVDKFIQQIIEFA